jgi:hypothetical protein
MNGSRRHTHHWFRGVRLSSLTVMGSLVAATCLADREGAEPAPRVGRGREEGSNP